MRCIPSAPRGSIGCEFAQTCRAPSARADQFYEDLKAYLEITEMEITSPDGLFTVEHVMCLAACDKAPMRFQYNFHFVENLDMEKMKAQIAEWRAESAGSKTAKKKP
ncbi:MAG: NAD(P)H-dependent oxidoreductase subunit E [Anaerolineae bacterium]